jgi:hypothetical protein
MNDTENSMYIGIGAIDTLYENESASVLQILKSNTSDITIRRDG